MTQVLPVSHAAPERRWRGAVLACLAAGALLAMATPLVLMTVRPSLATYLWHPAVILPAFAPYAVCAAIWLRRPADGRAGFAIAGLLLAATVVTHAPILWSPETFGGDMVALFFFGWAMAATAAVLLASAIAWLLLRLAGGPRAG